MTTSATIDDELLFLIHDVAQQMRRHSDRRARTRGMTRAQWVILVRLERQPGITQNDLAVLTDVEPITIGRLIDRLEQAGFVERRADPKDRRMWRLYLTPAVGPLLAEIAAFRRGLNEDMTEGITPTAVKSVISGLKTMRRNLSALETADKKRNVR